MPGSLTAADFLSLRMQYKNTREEGEWTAAIEHDFADGRMVDHYFLRPAPSLLADEAVQALSVLGFPPAAAQKVVLEIIKQQPDTAVEGIIKQALKML